MILPLAPIITTIDRTTKDSYIDLGLESSDFSVIVNPNTSTYGEQQSKELPNILFELYVEDTSNGKLYLNGLSNVWNYNNPKTIIFHRVPTDVQLRIVPVFNEDYIESLDESERTDSFDISILVDTNYGSGSGGGGGSSYTLPVASESTLGGIKVGDGLSITDDGTLSSSSVGSSIIYFSVVESEKAGISIRGSNTTPSEFNEMFENARLGISALPYISIVYEREDNDVVVNMQSYVVKFSTGSGEYSTEIYCNGGEISCTIAQDGDSWVISY